MKRCLVFLFALVLTAAFSLPASGEIRIDSTGEVLLDNRWCYMELVEVRDDPEAGILELELYAENRAGVYLEYATEYVVVNGCVMSANLFNALEPGRRAFDVLKLERAELERCGIGQCEELRIWFLIMTEGEEYWNTVYQGESCIYPSGKKKEEIVYPEPDCPWPQLVLSNAGLFDLKIADAKFLEDIPYYAVECVIANRAGGDLTFTCADVKVNGQEADPYWYALMPKGSRGIQEIRFDAAQLESLGISVPTEIEFTLLVYEGIGPDTGEFPLFRTRVDFFPAMG